ncbi:GGDEF domain-containing protein [Magnetofaba australis]|uniref:diguanylate cyclase n=1 Tax=Magnetofaba australis IT-1 TaxID=1434232 RepID=A0A1Y2KCH9_9PROT|nr:sensor domain-containing diguanylate cyclase [Magnetofaba australis]OSM08451.1 putative diguanylate cyclase [Magnetofaba australis IT-1]
MINLSSLSISKTFLALFLFITVIATGMLGSMVGYLKNHSINQMALNEARQNTELIFQSLLSVMRKGWTRDELEEVVGRLNRALPDIEIHTLRSQHVADFFGDVEDGAARRQEPLVAQALATGEATLNQSDHMLRFVYPVIAHQECISCHANMKEGMVNGVIDIRFPVERLRVPLEYTVNWVSLSFVSVLVILFLALFISVRRMLVHPITGLSRHMAEIRESQDPHKRLHEAETGSSEVRKLAHNFNTLLDRLDEASDQLRALSEVDALTGLANRRKFDQAFDVELARAKRYEHPFSLLMLDLNRFKPINDTYGHDAGDAILAGLGESLRTHLRQNDLIARVGGDEFAMLLPETGAEGARLMADKVVEMIEQTSVNYQGKTLSVGASVGVASYPEDGDGMQALQIAADQAMYADKARRKAGR